MVQSEVITHRLAQPDTGCRAMVSLRAGRLARVGQRDSDRKLHLTHLK